MTCIVQRSPDVPCPLQVCWYTILLNPYCIALGRCPSACASKHVVSAQWCTTSFYSCGLRSSGSKIWAIVDRSWWPNFLACTFNRPDFARLFPEGPHEELGLWDPCGFRGRLAGTGYGYVGLQSWSCVLEHGTYMPSVCWSRWSSHWALLISGPRRIQHVMWRYFGCSREKVHFQTWVPMQKLTVLVPTTKPSEFVIRI